MAFFMSITRTKIQPQKYGARPLARECLDCVGNAGPCSIGAGRDFANRGQTRPVFALSRSSVRVQLVSDHASEKKKTPYGQRSVYVSSHTGCGLGSDRGAARPSPKLEQSPGLRETSRAVALVELRTRPVPVLHPEATPIGICLWHPSNCEPVRTTIGIGLFRLCIGSLPIA